MNRKGGFVHGLAIFDSVRLHPVRSYFVLAFVLTWMTGLPLILSLEGVGLWHYRFAPTASFWMQGISTWAGPALAGVLITAITEGSGGLRRMFSLSPGGRASSALLLAVLIPVL